MKRKILLFIAVMCMAMGMEAQVNTENASENAPDQESVKKEAEENYKKGNKYWKAKDVDLALTYYGKAADAGHSEAQYIMGLLCIEGKHVLQNYDLAIEWLTKAAMQGHKDAQFKLAAIYHQGEIVPKDEQMAVYWATKYKEQPVKEKAKK